MRKIIPAILLLLALCVPARATTKVYLKQMLNSDTGLSQIYNYANPTDSVLATITSVTNSAASGTSIQWTATAGGTALKWISAPLSAGATISGTVTMNAWAFSSNTACNCAVAYTIKKYTAGAESTALLTGSTKGVNLTTSNAVQNWTGSPTSVTFAIGDRIMIEGLVVNVGTMGAGRTVTVNYGGKTGGASGDTWVQFNENLTFNAEPELIQSVATIISTAVTTQANVFTGTCAAGNTILVWAQADSATAGDAMTFADNQGGGSNTYSNPANGTMTNWVNTGGATGYVSDQVSVAKNIGGGSALTVTATFTITLTSGFFYSEEWAGLTTTPLDKTASAQSATGSSTAVNSGSITPSQAHSLIWGILDYNAAGGVTLTPSSANYVGRPAAMGVVIVYDYVIDASASSSFTGTLSAGSQWASFVGSFKAASQPAFTPTYLGIFNYGLN